jgi:hypothetical protein
MRSALALCVLGWEVLPIIGGAGGAFRRHIMDESAAKRPMSTTAISIPCRKFGAQGGTLQPVMGKEAEHKSESEPAQIFAEGSGTADLN